jgi:hypothetical protein
MAKTKYDDRKAFILMMLLPHFMSISVSNIKYIKLSAHNNNTISVLKKKEYIRPVNINESFKKIF